jgi:hypothetical protein
LLIQPENFPTVAARLNASDFYIQRHGCIWRALQNLAERQEAIDVVTLAGELEAQGKLEDAGGASYLAALMADVPTSLHAEAYARTVQRESARRRAIVIASSIAKAAYSPDGRLEATLGRAREQLDVLITIVGAKDREQYSPAELCAMPRPETPYRVRGRLIEGGVTLITADPGAGKTYCLLDAALGVHEGQSAYGQPSIQGPAMIVGPDNGLIVYRQRIQDLCRGRGIEPPASEMILDVSPFNLSNLADCLMLRRQCERDGIRFLGLDCLAAMLGDADENASGDMGLVMNHVRDIARESGTSIVVNHHGNKNLFLTSAARVRGSTAILASVDLAILLTSKGKGANLVRYLSVFKNRLEQEEATPATFAIESSDEEGTVITWGIAEQSEAEEAGGLSEAAVSMMVCILTTAGEPMTRTELEGALKRQGWTGSTRTLTRAVASLRNVPQVKVAKAGRGTLTYRVTEP